MERPRIPRGAIDGNRRLNITLLYTVEGAPRKFLARNFPNGLKAEHVCPHFIPWITTAPVEWLAQNVTGCWVRSVNGIHFSNENDAFAFKLRWV